jgi:HD superfamily phosphohydrolase
MPGIANISRYEHAIGAAYLASRVGFISRISRADALVLQAAAMLHDTAITAFGHLVEEALHYVSAQFDHEMKLSMLFQNSSDVELGGIDLQLYLGHESGIRAWAERTFGAEANDRLRAITATLTGKGRFGRCIVGDVDLDNLDNLTRIAFHMGLDVDRRLPLRIAARIVSSKGVLVTQKLLLIFESPPRIMSDPESRLVA